MFELSEEPIVEMQTRFIYPFFLAKGAVVGACHRLEGATTSSRDGTPRQVWKHEPIGQGLHAYYVDELFDHAIDFVFRHPAEGGCGYLRLTDEVYNQWFKDLEAPLTRATRLPLKVDRRAPIELFLSPGGVGVLSMSLSPEPETLRLEDALWFNYRLAQLRPYGTLPLRKRHPADDPAAWDRIPEEHRDKIGKPADYEWGDREKPGAEERLWRAGHFFTMGEMLEELLRPLSGPDGFSVRPVQNQLSVHTVVKFGPEVDFGDEGTRDDLGPFLSGLAQVEEPTHSGAPKAPLTVANAILNRRHWAAVTSLGGAHVLADQPAPDHGFNHEKVPRVSMKYFVGYLVPLLQRTSLHRIRNEVSRIVHDPESDTVAGLVEQRTQLLDFAVSAHFADLSSRAAVQQYYELAQRGLGVGNALHEVRTSMSEIDAREDSKRQVAITESQKRLLEKVDDNTETTKHHMHVVKDVQIRLEWIEILFLSVYAAHLFEMVAGNVEWLHDWAGPGIIASALLGGLLGAAILRPWRHQKHLPETPEALPQALDAAVNESARISDGRTVP